MMSLAPKIKSDVGRPAQVLAADNTDGLRLWGGIECTINRIGDHFRDQLDETGHAARDGDISLIANIGFEAIRYPILWEQIAPDDPTKCDWSWHDDRLARLHARGLRIIAGLVHHGSGPQYTNLLDPRFSAGLATHARAAAERYSFVNDWTPVNEPITTARFSALYGHWYPHQRDESLFWLAVLNQTDATRLAMREVRRINPAARLIQTEDLGRTYATGALRDQAAYDNVRRWMSWDLLCGLVKPGHDLWSRLCAFGLEDRLAAIAADPCPPDIIGINHYLTSDRFLDHRRRFYPSALAGTGAAYIDTEAVRVLDPPSQGLAGAVHEAWSRYGLPIAITEVHNGCTREDQLRWTCAAWKVAIEARASGINVSAVTSWALFGSSGWDTLLTCAGNYEAGAFDVSNGVPRPTAMVPLLEALAHDAPATHPVIQGEGWWTRPMRLHHRPARRTASMPEHFAGFDRATSSVPPPILIVGAAGTLGQALSAACRHRGIAHIACDRHALNLLEKKSVSSMLDRIQPWLVVNAAGWVRVDEAESQEEACVAINTQGALTLAKACDDRGIQSVSFSSDLVFDGTLSRPYHERDIPSPGNAYGRSKAEAERLISDLNGRHLIVRTAAFFSPFDPHNFAVHACEALERNLPFCASDEHIVSPTFVPDLCDAVLNLAIDGEIGIWHLTNGDCCTWAEFGRRLAQAAGLHPSLIIDIAASVDPHLRIQRPRYVPLVSHRGRMLPSLDNAITRFARDRRAMSHRSAFSPNISQ